MTTPYERWRHIIGMRELLADAAAETSLGPSATAAGELLLRYPTQRTMEFLVHQKAPLPTEVRAVLHDALVWSRQLACTAMASAEMKTLQQWVLRHFPEEDELAHQQALELLPGEQRPPLSHWIHPLDRPDEHRLTGDWTRPETTTALLASDHCNGALNDAVAQRSVMKNAAQINAELAYLQRPTVPAGPNEPPCFIEDGVGYLEPPTWVCVCGLRHSDPGPLSCLD